MITETISEHLLREHAPRIPSVVCRMHALCSQTNTYETRALYNIQRPPITVTSDSPELRPDFPCERTPSGSCPDGVRPFSANTLSRSALQRQWIKSTEFVPSLVCFSPSFFLPIALLLFHLPPSSFPSILPLLSFPLSLQSSPFHPFSPPPLSSLFLLSLLSLIALSHTWALRRHVPSFQQLWSCFWSPPFIAGC